MIPFFYLPEIRKLDILHLMKTAYIFHDSFADPLSYWYPWMKTTLEGMGYLVLVPKFPTPGAQSYESWKVVIKNYIPTFNEETILIGHGTGGLFALRLIEESPKQLGGLFLVATYAEAIGNVGYDRINTTFFEHTFNWEIIKTRALTIRIFAGDNDPFVPMGITQNLSQHLSQSVEVIPDGGHLNKAAGFTQAVAVAQGIKESLNNLDKSIQIEQVEEPVITQTNITTLDPSLPEKASEPLVPQDTPIVPAESSIQSHTMMQDLSHLVNSNQGRVASSLLSKARTDEAIKEAVSITSPKNIFYIIGIILSLAGTVIIIGYFLVKFSPVATIQQPVQIASIIPADTHQPITIVPNQPAFMLAEKIRSAVATSETPGQIRDMYYLAGTARASFNDALAGLAITHLPDGLSTQFKTKGPGPLFMHGSTQTDAGTGHFLVLPVENYDISFELMKLWEITLMRDIGPFFGISENFLRTRLTRDTFQDELLSNKNVRVLRYKKPPTITLEDAPSEKVSSSTSSNFVSEGIKNIVSQNPFVTTVSPYQENDIMLAYFFLNEHTLIITDNISIIPELLKRWANQQVYQ